MAGKECKPMNDNNSTTVKAERLSDAARLASMWKSIDWAQAEAEVNRLQVRIAKATQEKKWNTVKVISEFL
jgi:RNA-directed DNA polymerase